MQHAGVETWGLGCLGALEPVGELMTAAGTCWVKSDAAALEAAGPGFGKDPRADGLA